MTYKVTNSKHSSIMAPGKFRISYKVGEIVVAIPGTLGIMVFWTLQDAIRFIENNMFKDISRVLGVEGIGKHTCPLQICGRITETSFTRYYGPGPDRYHQTDPPIGTVCYRAVKVIKVLDRKEYS